MLLMAFPAIDLSVSRIFFDGEFHLASQWWAALLKRAIPWFLVASMAGVVGVYLYGAWSKRTPRAIDGRKVWYLLAVLVLGAGLVVNVALKDNLGRARPRDVAEFGGTARFTPAFFISHECTKNCSFPSGDAAAAFFSLALVRALTRNRLLYLAAIGFGATVSLARVAVGAHFLSDVLMSYLLMSTIAAALHHYLLSSGTARASVGANGEALDRRQVAPRR